MAAPCRILVRSAVEGLCCLSTRRLCSRLPLVQSVTCQRYEQSVLHCRALHCSHSALLNSTKTEQQKATESGKSTSERTKTEEEEEEDNGPEYIPKRKAKNPMMIIGYAWIIGLPAGVIGFILAKRQVDKNRLKQLKIRQRMKRANEGEYGSERYKTATGME